MTENAYSRFDENGRMSDASRSEAPGIGPVAGRETLPPLDDDYGRGGSVGALILAALSGAVMTAAAFLFFGTMAHAGELRVTLYQGVPTVAGVREAAPESWRPSPAILARPTAGVTHLREPAGPNGCPEPAFLAVSGSDKGTCYR